ncbi:MAG TPA: zf-HC2 domain-containing protein [bacterium]|nr:zf-HC2 domain-containing protein [bacterium]
MNSCDRITRNAHRYLDGTLSPREKQEMDAHLQNCPRCAESLAWARRSRQMLHALPRHTPSSNFDVVLHARMRQTAYERRSLWPLMMPDWLWQAPAYGAAALLLIGAGILIDRQFELGPNHPVAAQMAVVEESSTPARAAADPTMAPAVSKAPAAGIAGERLAASMPASPAAEVEDLASTRRDYTQAHKRYVMQKFSMQSLIRENRKAVGNRQAALEQLAFDTMQVRETTGRSRNLPGIRPVNASVQF